MDAETINAITPYIRLIGSVLEILAYGTITTFATWAITDRIRASRRDRRAHRPRRI